MEGDSGGSGGAARVRGDMGKECYLRQPPGPAPLFSVRATGEKGGRPCPRSRGKRRAPGSFLCPCRGPSRESRPAAAGHRAAAEREARGALEMCGAGARDPVTGAVGGGWRVLPTQPRAHCLALLCSCPSLCPAVSNLHGSSGNPFLGLEMEGSGSDEC